jgi:hypothetical protein
MPDFCRNVDAIGPRYHQVQIMATAFRRVLALTGFLLIALGVNPAGAAGCDAALRPAEGVNNLWFCHTGSKTVVVLVHGLHSDSGSAWFNDDPELNESQRYWPRLINADPRIENPDIYLGGFPTGAGSKDFGIREAAKEFFDLLRKPDAQGRSVLEKDNIIFAAHSLGGIVVRKTLVDNQEAFRGKRIGLLLIASPSFGSRDADRLTQLFAMTQARIGEQLRWGSDMLDDLDKDFDQLLRRRDGELRIVGRELYEQLPPTVASLKRYLGATVASIASFWVDVPVVEKESAVRYFHPGIEVFGADHFSIAKPTGPNHRTHEQLVDLFLELKATEKPGCPAPPFFAIELDVQTPADADLSPRIQDLADGPLPILNFRRLDDAGNRHRGVGAESALRNAQTGFHVLSPGPPFPCPGEMFQADFKRAPLTGELTGGADAPATRLCFRRSRETADVAHAFLRCSEGRACTPDPDNSGLAAGCQKSTEAPLLRLITTAKAEEPAFTEIAALSDGRHWVVPSLATLSSQPADKRTGFTEFVLTSGPLPGLERATHVTYAIEVNGVPIHIDGWPPHSESADYDSRKGLALRFGLENLGFTGGTDGYEKLRLTLRFQTADEILLHEAVLERSYVSYRHARPVELALAGAGTVTWQGWYRPSRVLDRAEVMLGVSKDVDGISRIRMAIEKNSPSYGGQEITGIVRPPREDNPWYGVSLGFKLASGQVRSSFALDEAKAICRWLVGGDGRKLFPGWMRRGAYVYEFKSEQFTETADRGSFLDLCTNIR